jgi:predicted signal transduction protein with EAL and GGDEF domain
LTFSSLNDIIKSTHAIDAKGGRLPIGMPGRLQIGMHGRLRRYPHLRSVARVLAEQAQRPADLVARYGGEEFVLLLPNTDAEGCEQVGEKVRGALHEFGMLHALNPPSKLVTVSLGGATNLPAGALAECTSLVEAADRALYAAKDSGRDRLVTSGQVIAWPGARSA